MRSYILPMTLFVITTTANLVNGEDFEKFNADDWKRYEAAQRVVRSMPAALRRQGDYALRSLKEIEDDPGFKEWSGLSPVTRLVEKNKIETRLAITRPYRQAAVGGYWSFNNPYLGWNRGWYGCGCGCGSPLVVPMVGGGSELW